MLAAPRRSSTDIVRHAALVFLCAAGIGVLQPARAQDLTLDYRYPPPRWNTPIGLPGDWHKPMVNEDGALVYDFGPGPYAKPGTYVSFGVHGDTLAVSEQTIENPRIPLVQTSLRGTTTLVTAEAFSVVPQHDWTKDDEGFDGDVQRLNGLNGMLAWADPPSDVDPAFRNVAYGTNRPIIYRIRVEPRAERKLAVGLADPYRQRGHRVTRIMVLTAEGAEPHTIDVVDLVGQNQPVVVQLDAIDTDGDGWIDFRVDADRNTVDGNIFVNVLWIFPIDTELDVDALIRGDLSDRAEHYVDCGRDPQVLARPSRTDILHAEFESAENVQPVLRVKTRRDLEFDESSKTLRTSRRPFILTEPQPIAAHRTDQGWELELPSGTVDAVAMVVHNADNDLRPVIPNVSEELTRLEDFWLSRSGLPWDRIVVSDSAMQALFDGSIRTMYQLTERVDGLLQTQPGPSVYRGLWVSNQVRAGRALTHLGDLETARASFEQTFRHQQEDGQIVVLTPPILLKETGTAVQAVYHHARLTRDREFLESYWPKIVKAGGWIARMRRLTTDSTALNYRLMPAGFSDGGIGGIRPEYTSVSWNLLATQNIADGAEWLGKARDAVSYRAELDDFRSAFRRAAARDLRQDKHGNWFLPILMEFDPEKHVPQRSQTQFAYMVYPGRIYEKDDPIVVGNMAMLADAPRAEGLVLTTGWLDGGVQPFIESTRAGARIYLGQIDMALQTLYAAANHAAPTHVWIEEQLPGTGPRRATGDVPHSSGSSEFINAMRYLIAIEDGENLDLLKGIPTRWIFPGAVIETNDVPTEFGRLTLKLSVSEDGKTVAIDLAPIANDESRGNPVIHLAALKQLGYRLPDGSELPSAWSGEWREAVSIRAVLP